LTRHLEVEQERQRLVKAQRDDYAKIAASHEVKLPELVRLPQTIVGLWKDRRYANHPEANLRDLRLDLAALGEQAITLKLGMEYFGGWKQLMAGAEGEARTDPTEPLRAGRQLFFEGPVPRVCQQLEAFFRDDDHRFVVVGEDGEKRWADADSPMAWLVAVDVVRGGELKIPEVHEVEVLRIQKEIEERVIEVPAVSARSPEDSRSLDSQTERQIIDLIDAVLEIREAGGKDLDGRLAALRAVAAKQPTPRLADSRRRAVTEADEDAGS